MNEREPLIKKVWYGVGKAVESQSPRAWNERIIKTINEKVIPKLTPEQLAWVAKNHKVIEGAATGLGVGISTAELIVLEVVAYKAIQVGYKKFHKMTEPGRIRNKINKKYTVFKAATHIDTPVVWASDPSSESVTSAISGPAIAAFAEKYGTGVEYVRFGKIMQAMQWGSVGMDGWGIQHQLSQIYESGRSPVKSPYAKLLKPLFLQTFKDIAYREKWFALTDTQKRLMDGYAQALFRKWKQLQFVGLPVMILAGRPWSDVTYKKAEEAVLRLARTPTDFWLKAKPELISREAYIIRPHLFVLRQIRKSEEAARKEREK